MAYQYSIKVLFSKLDTSVCPPPFLKELFPDFDGQPVLLTEQECLVTFETPQTPVQISPLVKVELISE